MENTLLTSDVLALKALFNEPLYLIKEEFKSIVELNQDNSISIQETAVHFEITGMNTKNIVFIVFTDDAALAELEKSLYEKTISALKLGPTDIGFSTLSRNLIRDFSTLSSKLQNQKVVCYGNSEIYTENLLQTIQVESTSFLLCPSLNELSSNNELKVKWWSSLKTFLNQ